MSLEIERKFLLKSDEWKTEISKSVIIKQGYLSTEKNRVVRIRTIDEQAFLTIKGETIGITRSEFEYEIPLKDALAMLRLCSTPIIEKTRHYVSHQNHTWEIDIFEGKNKGLKIAEIELQSANETFEKPNWIGKEVSDDERYFNAYLSKTPYSTWS